MLISAPVISSSPLPLRPWEFSTHQLASSWLILEEESQLILVRLERPVIYFRGFLFWCSASMLFCCTTVCRQWYRQWEQWDPRQCCQHAQTDGAGCHRHTGGTWRRAARWCHPLGCSRQQTATAEHRSLWNSDVKRDSVGTMLSHLNELCSVDEIGPQLLQRYVGDSELELQAFDQ